MKHYRGDRTIDGIAVTVDGRPLDPLLSVRRFSPNGFEWSYEGAEPEQLAFALLADHCGDPARALQDWRPATRVRSPDSPADWSRRRLAGIIIVIA